MRSPWSFLIFFGVFFLVSGLIHFFLYRGVVRGLSISSPAALWTLRFLAVLLAVSYPLVRWLDTWAPDPVIVLAHWTASVWIGLMWHLLWSGFLLWLVKMLLVLSGAWGRLETHHTLLGKSAVGLVVALAVILGSIGILRAHRPARIRTVRIPVKALTPAAAGLKIVLVSDLHAGVLAGPRLVERWVSEVNALDPDVVLVPGDIIDSPPDRMPEVAEAYRGLRAPLGVFAVTGNHEYIVAVRRSVAFLEKCGMRVLRNEVVELPGDLLLAGVDDPAGRSFDVAPPLIESVIPERAKRMTTILMNHTPGTAATRDAMAAGVDLAVSGHTHGGQIWPFGYVVRSVFPYFHGLYPVGDGHQLTTCGIGFWGPPMRLGADPEIWVIELVRDDDRSE